MSIPIDPSRAVGGHLATGDRIDVLFAGDREVSIIVRDAEVIAVDAKGRGGIGETNSPFTVTIAVNAAQSQLLAAAIADGDISLARTTGAGVVAGHRAATTRPGRRACRRPAVGAHGTHHCIGLLARALGRTAAPPPHRPRRRARASDRARARAGARGRIRHAGREPSVARPHACVRRSGAPALAVCARRLRSRRDRGREHLAALGVDGTIPSDAAVSEFIEALTALTPARVADPRRAAVAAADPVGTGPDGHHRPARSRHQRSRARTRRRDRSSG